MKDLSFVTHHSLWAGEAPDERAQEKHIDYADLASLFEPYVWEWFEDTFGEPSPPQIASWPRIAQGKNTLIFSPTGSGKTLAAFLWCIMDSDTDFTSPEFLSETFGRFETIRQQIDEQLDAGAVIKKRVL